MNLFNFFRAKVKEETLIPSSKEETLIPSSKEETLIPSSKFNSGDIVSLKIDKTKTPMCVHGLMYDSEIYDDNGEYTPARWLYTLAYKYENGKIFFVTRNEEVRWISEGIIEKYETQ